MVNEFTNSNGDDAASNPNAEEHLPTAGEFRTAHVPEDGTITEVDDNEDLNDMSEISSKSTDFLPEVPDLDEPAYPVATGDKSY